MPALTTRLIPHDLEHTLDEAIAQAWQLARNASNNADTDARDAYGTVARSLEQIRDAVTRYADTGEA